MFIETKDQIHARQIIMQYFPIVDEGRLWTEDEQHGVVLEEGFVTMLDADGCPRTRKPSYAEFAYMLHIGHDTVDEVANEMNA